MFDACEQIICLLAVLCYDDMLIGFFYDDADTLNDQIRDDATDVGLLMYSKS